MKIDNFKISKNNPTYFIADIAANHDGDINRAVDLIYSCAEAGANAAKFQHFHAKTIVSDSGFKSLVDKKSHQSKWKKSVFDVYKDAEVDLNWTEKLKDTCKKAGITFFTSPYSMNLVDEVDQYVPAYKIGSGDITWIEIIKYIASKNKPYILATGASSIDDVDRAVKEALKINSNLGLMQCNTNYTASLENFKYIHLNVLKKYSEMYPELILGLSDHTPGHATVLGAVTLGARLIEKHYTDDNDRVGPDHLFSMNPDSWKEMVLRTRELEYALGSDVKKIEENEKETVIVQRRSIWLKKDINSGDELNPAHFEVLRPSPEDSIQPYEISNYIGKKIKNSLKKGQYLRKVDFE